MRRARFLSFSVAGLIASCLLPAVAEAQAGPYQFFALTPCRVYDTRTGQPSAGGTNGGRLVHGAVRQYRLKTLCGIPGTAQAVSLNLTVVGPTGGGDLRIAPWNPNGPSDPNTYFPVVSTLNYVAGDVLANGAIVPLASISNPPNEYDFMVIAAITPFDVNSKTDLIIDVNGYFQ